LFQVWDLRIQSELSKELSARLTLCNKGKNLVRNLRLSVSETALISLVRDSGLDGDLDLGFSLSPHQSRDFVLIFRVDDCVSPMKLRGTLTYTIVVSSIYSLGDVGNSNHFYFHSYT